MIILNDNSCFATTLYDVYVCMIILVLNKGLLYTNERQIESNTLMSEKKDYVRCKIEKDIPEAQ